tara:strand:- start:957 stop:1373 length:417 start_codon:yes stop_codon:yes gene_type:complete
MYNLIEKYKEYFHSVRLHDSILLLDLKLPSQWEIKKVLTALNGTTQLKINDKAENHTLFSFYSPFIEKEIDTLIKDVDTVIKWNKDREEKVNLLNVKILELKKMFETNNLDSLRNINFDFQQSQNGIKLNEEETKLVR